jgi:phosphatidylserine decarboxylase
MNQQEDMQEKSRRRRLGGWMPTSDDSVAVFRRDLASRARERSAQVPLSSVVRDLAGLVNRDSLLRMHLTRAIDQALEQGHDLGYSTNDELFHIIDYILTYAPPFNAESPVMTPLNAVLEWLVCMPAGYHVLEVSGILCAEVG